MILRVESAVMKAGVLTGQETRHFITSLGADAVSPKRLMELVRGHLPIRARADHLSRRLRKALKFIGALR
jgi:hypothetical protein